MAPSIHSDTTIYFEEFEGLTRATLDSSTKGSYCDAVMSLYTVKSENSKKGNKSNSTYHFQSHISNFIECFPHWCEMRQLKKESTGVSPGRKKEAMEKRIAELKSMIELKFNIADFSYYSKLHRPLNDVNIGRFRSTAIADKYNSPPFDDDVRLATEEDELLTVVSVEDSFDVLCNLVKKQKEVSNKKLVGARSLWESFDKKKFHGITLQMTQFFAQAIYREQSRMIDPPVGNDDYEEVEEEDLSDGEKSSSSFSLRVKVKGSRKILFTSSSSEEERSEDESEKEAAPEPSNIIEMDNTSVPSKIIGTYESGGSIEGTLCAVEGLSSLDNYPFTPLSFDDPPFTEAIVEESVAKGEGEKNVNVPINQGLQSLESEAMFEESVAKGGEEKNANVSPEERIAPRTELDFLASDGDFNHFMDLRLHLSNTEKQHEENAAAVRNSVLSNSREQKFYHVMINVYTITLRRKRQHVLCIFDLVTHFLICRHIMKPFDLVEVGLVLSQVFGDHNFPRTVSYYDHGSFFKESNVVKMTNASGNEEYIPLPLKDRPIEASEIMSSWNVLSLHKRLFYDTVRLVAHDEDRLITVNLCYHNQLENGIDERFTNFMAKLTELVNKDVNNKPINFWYGLAQIHANSSNSETIATNPFELYYGRRPLYHKKIGEAYACWNFWVSSLEDNNSSSIESTSIAENAGRDSEKFYNANYANTFGYPPIISPFGDKVSLNPSSPCLKALEEKLYVKNYPVDIARVEGISSAFSCVFQLLQEMPKYNCILNEIVSNVLDSQSQLLKGSNQFLLSYVYCGRLLFDKQSNGTLTRKDRHCNISSFHSEYMNSFTAEHGVEIPQVVAHGESPEAAAISLLHILAFSYKEVTRQNEKKGTELLSLLCRPHVCNTFCSTCASFNTEKLNAGDDSWIMSIKVPQVIPQDCLTIIKITEIDDCLIHLSDLIRIHNCNWKVPFLGTQCTEASKNSCEKHCSLMKTKSVSGSSENLIVSLNRNKGVAVKVYVPEQLDVDLADDKTAKYRFVCAVTKETETSNKGVSYSLVKKYKQKWIRMTNGTWSLMNDSKFRLFLYEHAIMILYEIDTSETDPIDSKSHDEIYEFNVDIKKVFASRKRKSALDDSNVESQKKRCTKSTEGNVSTTSMDQRNREPACVTAGTEINFEKKTNLSSGQFMSIDSSAESEDSQGRRNVQGTEATDVTASRDDGMSTGLVVEKVANLYEGPTDEIFNTSHGIPASAHLNDSLEKRNFQGTEATDVTASRDEEMSAAMIIEKVVNLSQGPFNGITQPSSPEALIPLNNDDNGRIDDVSLKGNSHPLGSVVGCGLESQSSGKNLRGISELPMEEVVNSEKSMSTVGRKPRLRIIIPPKSQRLKASKPREVTHHKRSDERKHSLADDEGKVDGGTITSTESQRNDGIKIQNNSSVESESLFSSSESEGHEKNDDEETGNGGTTTNTDLQEANTGSHQDDHTNHTGPKHGIFYTIPTDGLKSTPICIETEKEDTMDAEEHATINTLSEKSASYERAQTGEFVYEDKCITFPTNNGYTDYYKFISSQKGHPQPCLYCSQKTIQYWGKFTYICSSCTDEKNSGVNSSKGWMNHHCQEVQQSENQAESHCLNCYERFFTYKPHHTLGEYKFCENCILNGICKCIICALPTRFPFAKIASSLKNNYHRNVQKYLDTLYDIKMNTNIPSDERSALRKDCLKKYKNSINEHVSYNCSDKERNVLTMLLQHEEKYVAMHKFAMLKTADVQALLYWKKTDRKDPMTTHVMQYFIQCFASNSSTLESVNFSLQWSNDQPANRFTNVLESVALRQNDDSKRHYYVGRKSSGRWFTYEMIFKNNLIEGRDHAKASFNYFDLQGDVKSDFDDVKKTILRVWVRLGYQEKNLTSGGNDLSRIGSKSTISSERSSSENISSLYIVYYLINCIGKYKTEVHDKTITDLKWHFILGLLTGEPSYSFLYH